MNRSQGVLTSVAVIAMFLLLSAPAMPVEAYTISFVEPTPDDSGASIGISTDLPSSFPSGAAVTTSADAEDAGITVTTVFGAADLGAFTGTNFGLSIGLTEPSGGLSDAIVITNELPTVQTICTPPPFVICRPVFFPGRFVIAFTSDTESALTGPVNTTIPETGSLQDLTSLILSTAASQLGLTLDTTFSSISVLSQLEPNATSTPEPSTLLLLGAGLVGVSATIYRRRRN